MDLQQPKIGIIGGGIMGICLGYYLSQQGAQVEIFEASTGLGGLAGPITLGDGTRVDRFYHAILSSDAHLQALCRELGIEDRLRFRETRMGFYDQGKISPMNNLVDFLRFPPLNWIDRFRLGLTVLAAQFIRDWHELEDVSVEDWLLRWSGPGVYRHIWRPLLRAKFDGNFSETPATYIWSRLVRMKSTRNGASQKEQAGHLIGGYLTLMQALAERIRANGGRIHLRTPVQEILVENAGATGVRVGSEALRLDAVVATIQVPILRRMLPVSEPSVAGYLQELGEVDYLGVIAPLLVLDRPLSGYWTINITDESIPFTGVIETTAYIDPEYVGGHHLVYLPKYTAPGSPWQQKPDDEIREIWFQHLEKMFPDFRREQVRYFLVNRERFVEPVHRIHEGRSLPALRTPLQNFFLTTTAQIYPDLTNGESVSKHAHRSAAIIMDSLQLAESSSRPGKPIATGLAELPLEYR